MCEGAARVWHSSRHGECTLIFSMVQSNLCGLAQMEYRRLYAVMPQLRWRTADGVSLMLCCQGSTELCPITSNANAVQLKRLACKSLISRPCSAAMRR